MGTTVTVGCKLPNGLIIDVDDVRVVLNGANSSSVIGGHGITEGVSKEVWEAFNQRNPDFEPVKRGLVFVQEALRNVRAEALEKVNNVTGFEGLDNKNPIPGIKKDED